MSKKSDRQSGLPRRSSTNRRAEAGEIATIIALGSMAFILVTTLITSTLSNKPQTTSTLAATCCTMRDCSSYCTGGTSGKQWCLSGSTYYNNSCIAISVYPYCGCGGGGGAVSSTKSGGGGGGNCPYINFKECTDSKKCSNGCTSTGCTGGRYQCKSGGGGGNPTQAPTTKPTGSTGLPRCSAGSYMQKPGCEQICGVGQCSECDQGGQSKWECKNSTGGNNPACSKTYTFSTLSNCKSGAGITGACDNCTQCTYSGAVRYECNGSGSKQCTTDQTQCGTDCCDNASEQCNNGKCSGKSATCSSIKCTTGNTNNYYYKRTSNSPPSNQAYFPQRADCENTSATGTSESNASGTACTGGSCNSLSANCSLTSKSPRKAFTYWKSSSTTCGDNCFGENKDDCTSLTWNEISNKVCNDKIPSNVKSCSELKGTCMTSCYGNGNGWEAAQGATGCSFGYSCCIYTGAGATPQQATNCRTSGASCFYPWCPLIVSDDLNKEWQRVEGDSCYNTFWGVGWANGVCCRAISYFVTGTSFSSVKTQTNTGLQGVFVPLPDGQIGFWEKI